QVVSTSGTSLDAIVYDPYGKTVNQTNAANAPRIGYAGGIVDSITGNIQLGERPYNPADGRFALQDPIGFSAGDLNLYRYVFNSPVSLRDPSGEDIYLVTGNNNNSSNSLF